jgi:hypothetical protein
MAFNKQLFNPQFHIYHIEIHATIKNMIMHGSHYNVKIIIQAPPI